MRTSSRRLDESVPLLSADFLAADLGLRFKPVLDSIPLEVIPLGQEVCCFLDLEIALFRCELLLARTPFRSGHISRFGFCCHIPPSLQFVP